MASFTAENILQKVTTFEVCLVFYRAALEQTTKGEKVNSVT